MNVPFTLSIITNKGSNSDVKWLCCYYRHKNAGPQDGLTRRILKAIPEDTFKEISKSKAAFCNFLKNIPTFKSVFGAIGIEKPTPDEFKYIVSHIKLEDSNFSNEEMDIITNSLNEKDYKELKENKIENELESKSDDELKDIIENTDMEAIYDELVHDEYP